MITENYNLSQNTTLRAPATAAFCITLKDATLTKEEVDLIENNPTIILGEGSNTFFVKNFPGVVIKNEILGKEILRQDEQHVAIRIGAGENWDDLVAWTLEKGFYGLENLSLIPGTVGAAPVQNIGAYGKEIADYVVEVTGIDLATRESKTYKKDQCQFNYRNSIFKSKLKNQFLITAVTLQLDRVFSPEVSYATLAKELERQNIVDPVADHVRQAVIAVRQSRLPDWKTTPNAGSFFKNPIIPIPQYTKLQKTYPDVPSYAVNDKSVKIPAAWLIDQAGLKGFSEGNVGTYEKQPLVIISNGNASGQEIVNFANHIRTVVSKKFGILLEPEVNSIGYDFKNT